MIRHFLATIGPALSAACRIRWLLLLSLACGLALARPGFSDETGTWSHVSDAFPCKGFDMRQDYATVVYNGRIWILGGSLVSYPSGGSIVNDVWSSTDGTSWTQVTAAADWGPRYGHAAAVFQGRMWVFGGMAGVVLNDVWSSTDGAHWTQETAAAQWSRRTGHGVTVHGGRLWLTGGLAGNYTNTDLSNEVWSSANGRDWALVTANPTWAPRSDHLFYEGMGRMWLFGGCAPSMDGFYADSFQSADGRSWAILPPPPGYDFLAIGSIASAGAFYRQRLWVVGGRHESMAGTLVNNHVFHSSDGLSWTLDSGTPWWPRSDFGGVVYDDRFWIFGGFWDGPDIWALDIPDPQGWHRVGLAGRTVQGLAVRGRELLACTDAGISACNLDAATTSATVWNSLGLAAQNVLAVYVHPTTSTTLYAAALPPDAGAAPPPDEVSFFRSRNNGATWQQADAGIHGLRTRALAGTPSADGATTPTLFFAADGALARSRDGANWWQTVHAQPGWIYYAVACDPTSASVVWAGGSAPASSGGTSGTTTLPFLLRSRDGGDSWINLLAGDTATSLGACVTHIALDARMPGTVRAYCSGFVWQTADRGATHTVRPAALNLTWAESADPAAPDHLYGAGRQGAEDQFGFAESQDRAARWVLPAHAREGTSEILALALDPASPRVAFAGTRGTGIVRRALGAPTTATLRTLTLVASPHGTAIHWPEGWTHPDGTTLTLTAMVDPGWYFRGWTGDQPSSATASQTSIVVTMDRDRTLRADFGIQRFALTTIAFEGGTIVRAPDAPAYDAGTTVMLTARPQPGWSFHQWAGDLPADRLTANPLTVTMDAARTICVQFSHEASSWTLY